MVRTDLLREIAEALTPLVDGRATAYSSAVELDYNLDGEAWAATLVTLRSRIQAELNNIESDSPEDLNEVPSERPGGDQQSEETPNCPACGYPDKAVGGPFKGIYTHGKPCAACGYTSPFMTLLHRQLFPVSDATLHPIPAGATHYALRCLVDGPAVDFWGSLK